MSRSQRLFVGNLYAPRWATRPATVEWANLHGIEKQRVDVRGWSLYRLLTKSPLLREPEPTGEKGCYEYQFIIRQSGPRFLLACSASEVLEHLLAETQLQSRLSSPKVDVAGLVSLIVERPKDYALSALWAGVDGYGQSLRTMILYGTDLADAKLFRDTLPRIAPYRVTLRSQTGRDDILTVSSRGEVTFAFRNSRSLRQIDQTLRFFAENKFMDWNLE